MGKGELGGGGTKSTNSLYWLRSRSTGSRNIVKNLISDDASVRVLAHGQF